MICCRNNSKMNKENKKYKTFREYYADPEYRKKHLEYITQTVECPNCDLSCQRVAMARHRQSKRHFRLAKEKQDNQLLVPPPSPSEGTLQCQGMEEFEKMVSQIVKQRLKAILKHELEFVDEE